MEFYFLFFLARLFEDSKSQKAEDSYYNVNFNGNCDFVIFGAHEDSICDPKNPIFWGHLVSSKKTHKKTHKKDTPNGEPEGPGGDRSNTENPSKGRAQTKHQNRNGKERTNKARITLKDF